MVISESSSSVDVEVVVVVDIFLFYWFNCRCLMFLFLPRIRELSCRKRVHNNSSVRLMLKNFSMPFQHTCECDLCWISKRFPNYWASLIKKLFESFIFLIINLFVYFQFLNNERQFGIQYQVSTRSSKL